ncbi:hypothetical protein AB5J62_24775 [Amycolatopsis sp. cg5]|uniref:hypothetical protein n=1 Tax=Amycolatopsis sp. cg5 TaxID=3238802 RepID=UPI0035233660
MLLKLAAEGRLVMDAADADAVLSGLRRTLLIGHTRLADAAVARGAGPAGFTADALGQKVIDLSVAELTEPGRPRYVLDELSKCVEALSLVTKLSGFGDHFV